MFNSDVKNLVNLIKNYNPLLVANENLLDAFSKLEKIDQAAFSVIKNLLYRVIISDIEDKDRRIEFLTRQLAEDKKLIELGQAVRLIMKESNKK